jgi:hypothetical protein
VFLDGDEGRTSVGMDCSWYPTFLQAFFESHAAADLPIWHVVKTERTTGKMQAPSGEGDWEATWAKLTALQAADPANQYDMIGGRP